MPEMTAARATALPTQPAPSNIVLEGGDERGAVVDQLVVGHQAHDRSGHGDVEQAAGGGADHRGPADVAAGILDPAGGDGGALDADEGEEGDPGGDADGVVEAAAARR